MQRYSMHGMYSLRYSALDLKAFFFKVHTLFDDERGEIAYVVISEEC